MKRIRRLAVLGAASALALTACAPGSGGSGPKNTSAPKTVNTDVAKAGKVTLTVWDQEVRGGQDTRVKQLNDEFEKKYPNVTIKRVSRSFNDLQATLKLALSGNKPPDVVEANQGYGQMGEFVKAGMLTPLDAYAKAYGWDKRYAKSLLDLNRFTPDGKTFGSGNLYGASMDGEIVGVFYNKAKLAKIGAQPPATWADFQASLATAKSKGELPIALGNLDKYPAIHELGVVQAQAAGKQAVRNLVFGRGGSFADAPNVAAASTLADWVKKGYLTPNVNGAGYDDAWKKFATGGAGVYFIGGTWLAADMPKGAADLGFMTPPPAKAGGAPQTTGGESLPLAVTSKSPHPDVSAAYIDFMTSPHAMDVGTRNGLLPVSKPPSAKPSGPIMPDVFAAWQKVTDTDGLVPYLDYTTPDFADTLDTNLQKLLGGKATPDATMKALQADYQKFKSGK
ncbi:MAG TPA: extracellular solute-binding protein [Streptosporangiaceae bacterium]|jgi:raffinose/stachyose/melibiose transport system substrate-binding protein